MNSAAIWTVNFTTDYKDKKWSQTNFQTEFIKGLGDNKDARKDYPWDFYAGVF